MTVNTRPSPSGLLASGCLAGGGSAGACRLSADQLAAAACYDSTASALTARFRVARGAASSCRALVEPNWSYFDAALPRSAPQVVMLGMFGRCLSPESLAQEGTSGCNVNRKLVETLDWDGVRAWLDRQAGGREEIGRQA